MFKEPCRDAEKVEVAMAARLDVAGDGDVLVAYDTLQFGLVQSSLTSLTRWSRALRRLAQFGCFLLVACRHCGSCVRAAALNKEVSKMGESRKKSSFLRNR
jgi:hypothetical protein